MRMAAISYFSIGNCAATSVCDSPSYSPCSGTCQKGDKGDKGDPGEGSESCCPAHGDGSPEGVVTKPEGQVYVDDLTQDVYIKISGDDAFGWVIQVGPTTSTIGLFVVGSIAQARALPSLITNRMLAINGDMTGGDGFTHLNYTWDQGSSAANNNGSVLQSTDLGVGRWLQN